MSESCSVEHLIGQWLDDAWAAREMAHCPYSNFPVGALCVVEGGDVFTGCNVENISFGLTNCAERVAIQKAVASGYRKIKGVVVVADTKALIMPCGACRQVMAEFETKWVVLANKEAWDQLSLPEIFPFLNQGILDSAK